MGLLDNRWCVGVDLAARGSVRSLRFDHQDRIVARVKQDEIGAAVEVLARVLGLDTGVGALPALGVVLNRSPQVEVEIEVNPGLAYVLTRTCGRQELFLRERPARLYARAHCSVGN